jgi:hypothetical protein
MSRSMFQVEPTYEASPDRKESADDERVGEGRVWDTECSESVEPGLRAVRVLGVSGTRTTVMSTERLRGQEGLFSRFSSQLCISDSLRQGYYFVRKPGSQRSRLGDRTGRILAIYAKHTRQHEATDDSGGLGRFQLR